MLSLTNPATGKTIARVPTDTAKSVREKFQRARTAQPAWAALPLERRLRTIKNFRGRLVAETESLAKTLTREVGKPIRQSRNELAGTLARIDFFLDETAQALRAEKVFSERGKNGAGLEERITHEPLGVVASISAWNYPYFVGSNVFLPALLAGNAVLYKPSEFATLTGLAIARLLHVSGVPEEIFVPLIGSGEVGTALLAQPIDGVFFTGSNQTGSRIARAVSGRLIKVQLELGGKDPAYVCEDVDVATAAAGLADGAFYNTGQSCCSVERIYVRREIHDAFVAAFVDEVKRFKIGDPLRDNTYIGPLTRAAQIDVLETQIADALKKGATLLTGGQRLRRTGNYFAPTVLTKVNHRMALMRDESFSPVIGIMAVDSDDDAVRLMNDSDYGLTAAVYTPNRRRAETLLRQVHSGSAYWNCCDRVSPRLPWSGTGASGIGLTLSKYGIQTFTRPKAWHLRSVEK